MSSIITIVEDFKEFKQPITEQFYLILFDLVAQHKTHYIESLNENTNEIYELINNIFTNNGIKPITHYEFQAGFNINDVRFLLFYCFTMYLMASYSWNRTIRNDLIAVGNMMIEKKDYLPVIIEDIKIILDGLEVKTIVFNDLIPWSRQHSMGISLRIRPLCHTPCLSCAVSVNMASFGSFTRRPC